MFSTLRNRFGIPGVISVMALVFAMFGGAYAASNSSDGGGKATASAAKGKPGPRGKTGKTGPAGPAGPTGPAGAAGPKGDAGAKGDNGSNGSNGTAGQSVTSAAEPPGGNCANGGSKFVASNGTTYACNGATGAKGAAGSPWTLGGTLPTGATETGVWGYGDYPAPFETAPGNEGTSSYTISFPIPLAAAPQVTFVDVFGGETTGTGCPGIVNNLPKADPGTLCVYATGFESAKSSGFSANVTGGFVTVQCLEKFCSTDGIWAVTGA